MTNYPLNTLLDIPADEYFAHPYVSRSTIAAFATMTPRAYWYKYLRDGAEGFTGTDATRRGTAFHDLILEPEQFRARNLFAPIGLGRQSKADKAKWAELEQTARASSAAIHPGDDEEILYRMARSVHETLPDLMGEGGISEATVFFECPVTGVGMKLRMDRYFPKTGIIRDLKTSSDPVDPQSFRRTALYKRRYDLQAAFYLQGMRAAGLEANRFIFDVVESCFTPSKRDKWPDAASHDLGDGILEAATADLRAALLHWSECSKLDYWPTGPSTVYLHSESESLPEPTSFSEF